jgi:16S rRNA (cytidine1402-2'-O)-methyltransferase
MTSSAQVPAGTHFLVATPIGNLEDITLRALRLLSEVSMVAAEDTRTTRRLLAHHGIKAKVLSYNEHNMKRRTPELLRALAAGSVALVSDAGTPGVSDPGYELTVAALAAGYEVSPVPGPASVVAAVTASGLPAREFTFLGFLPRRAKERRDVLSRAGAEPRTLVFFESPHRLQATLSDLATTLGDQRRIAVCRELTKRYEEIFRGTVAGAIAHFTEARGEFTVVVEGALPSAPAASDDDLREALRRLRAEGLSARDASTQVAAETGVPRRRVYALSLEEQAPDGP